MREHPTHCVKGHPAMWCTCKRFVAAPAGTFPAETDTVCLHFPKPDHNLNQQTAIVQFPPLSSPSPEPDTHG